MYNRRCFVHLLAPSDATAVTELASLGSHLAAAACTPVFDVLFFSF